MQQHDYFRDPSNTIVKTRPQRAHRGQFRNNLQAGQTSNNLQAEAPTVDAPPQLIMAAAPSANPTPQAPVFTLGPGQDNTVLEWSIPADTKLNSSNGHQHPLQQSCLQDSSCIHLYCRSVYMSNVE